jgi:uncharacterized protein (TIGR03905 family)
MREYIFKTEGVCSKEITVNVDNGILLDVSFLGGCNGNLKAISKLVSGMKVEDVIENLKGIDCKGKGTSCADQLCIALSQAVEEDKKI